MNDETEDQKDKGAHGEPGKPAGQDDGAKWSGGGEKGENEPPKNPDQSPSK